MCVDDEILNTEILNYRVPPDQPPCANTKCMPDGKECVTTSGVSPGRKSNQIRSCSRASITSPLDHQRILRDKDRGDWQDWRVAKLKVRDAINLGFGIEFERTEEDPGHCNVELLNKEKYSGKGRERQWGYLGEKSIVLTPEEIATGVMEDW